MVTQRLSICMLFFGTSSGRRVGEGGRITAEYGNFIQRNGSPGCYKTAGLGSTRSHMRWLEEVNGVAQWGIQLCPCILSFSTSISLSNLYFRNYSFATPGSLL